MNRKSIVNVFACVILGLITQTTAIHLVPPSFAQNDTNKNSIQTSPDPDKWSKQDILSAANLVVITITALILLSQAASFISQTKSIKEQAQLLVEEIKLIKEQIDLLKLQIESTYKWNLRKNTHDYLNDAILGSLVMLRRKLEAKGIDPFDQNQVYNGQQLSALETLLVRDILNYMEQMSLAIDYQIIDELAAYDCARGVVLEYWRWAKPYVEERRKALIDQNRAEIANAAWKSIEKLAAKWKNEWQSLEQQATVAAERARSREISPILDTTNSKKI